MLALWFFFSSRRRHTRFDCDWSSDVCSSDLARGRPPRGHTPAPPAPSVRLVTTLRARGPSKCQTAWLRIDRKSTRLNSSHSQISYAVFCLKKKNHVVRLECKT